MSEPMKPMEIEQRSFAIITELLGDRVLAPENELVIKRAIHTTADFDYADNLVFSEHAVQKGLAALRSGCDIVTDTQMDRAGINKTIFATADDELRPVMNGIYINLAPDALTFVGTDAHKLVKYEAETENEVTASFILPKKPANLLKSVLLKEDDAIEMAFDSKNALFKLKSHTLVCRLIEGNYPNYNAVIPSNNPNKVLVDRIELVNGIKRVAVCSNPTTNLIRMDIADNRITLTAQDIDFSVSANETISCSYDGQPISIGFKSTFLVEILSNMDTPTVVVELADSTRAGVFKPVYDDKQPSATLMLLMPMMINA